VYQINKYQVALQGQISLKQGSFCRLQSDSRGYFKGKNNGKINREPYKQQSDE
jgi:hypothetical protein